MLGQTHTIAGALAAAVALHVTGAPAAFWVPGLAAGAAASLLPDADTPGSTAARAVPVYRAWARGTVAVGLAMLAAVLWAIPRSGWRPALVPPMLWVLPAMAAAVAGASACAAREIITHRGPTHSLTALALFGLGIRALWPGLAWPLWVSLLSGYASHIAIDLFNPNGVAVLWPLSPRKWSVRDSPLLLPLWPLVVRTGSPGEVWGWRSALTVLLVAGTLWHFAVAPAAGAAILKGVH